VLDSLLTLTRGAAAWMAGALILCLLLDRAVSALTGNPVTIFLVFALGILLAFAVSGTYTAVKWLRRRVHPQA